MKKLLLSICLALSLNSFAQEQTTDNQDYSRYQACQEFFLREDYDVS